jgi:thiamine biosynthesis lipoprotein ApbE
MPAVTLACHAMATRFEIVLPGNDPVRLRAAGEEALHEIGRLEAQLSLYRQDSEIAQVNARAAREPVRVSPRVFALLQQAERLSQQSGGAFDIAIGALVRCWGFRDGNGTLPDPGDLARAREQSGMRLVQLNPADSTVRFEREGVRLDLGAIGKGYGVDRAVEILREAGVTSALVHGGTSTVYALGQPPEGEFWQVAVAGTRPEPSPEAAGGAELPLGLDAQQPAPAGFMVPMPARKRKEAFHELERRAPSRCQTTIPSIRAEAVLGAPIRGFIAPRRSSGFAECQPEPCATVTLKNEALSVSAVWGKSFQSGGRTFGHVLDPRTGRPVEGALLAAVVLPSAAETDALSTALLVLGSEGHEQLSALRPGVKTLLLRVSGAGMCLETNGLSAEAKR